MHNFFLLFKNIRYQLLRIYLYTILQILKWNPAKI